MTTIRMSFIPLIFSLFSVFAAAQEPPGQLTVVTDSMLQDRRMGSMVQVERSGVALEDLSELDVKTADGQTLVDLERLPAISVTVFVPASLSEEERKAFTDAVEAELNSRYKIKKFRARAMSVHADEIIEAVEAHPEPIHPEDRSLWRKGREATVTGLKKWSEKTKSLAQKIKAGRYSARARDWTVGFGIGLGKTGLSWSYWLTATGLNVYGLGQAALSTGLDILFQTIPGKINDWKATHKFPVLSGGKLAQWYNNTPFVKTLVINQLIALSTAYAFRGLSHLDDPENVTSPNSLEFFGQFGGMALIGTPIGAAGDMGVVTLTRKGYLSGRAEHYIFNFFGLGMQINGLLFGSDRIQYLKYGLAAEWGIKTVAWAAAKILPAKKNRVVVIHPGVAVKNVNDVLYLMGMKDVIKATEASEKPFAELIEKHAEWKLDGCEEALK